MSTIVIFRRCISVSWRALEKPNWPAFAAWGQVGTSVSPASLPARWEESTLLPLAPIGMVAAEISGNLRPFADRTAPPPFSPKVKCAPVAGFLFKALVGWYNGEKGLHPPGGLADGGCLSGGVGYRKNPLSGDGSGLFVWVEPPVRFRRGKGAPSVGLAGVAIVVSL